MEVMGGYADLENINKHVDELQEQIKREALDNVKPALTKAVKYFFDNVKGVDKIGWTQYTPYFNDGDECIFGVNDLMVHYEDEEVQAKEEEYDGMCYVYTFQGADNVLSKEEIEVFKGLEKCLMKNPDLLKLAFGDHSQIIIDKEGNVEAEEYEHD